METAADPIDFDTFLLLVGRLNYTWTNTESLLIHFIAGLSGVDKETATVIFLTLNTTRARIDIVERLSKLERVSDLERERILSLTKRIQNQSSLRNRYNHCIYAFDSEGGSPRTILMRIADRKDHLLMGQVHTLDHAAAKNVEHAIEALQQVNQDIWQTIGDMGYPL